jgi:HK97 family phage major capsid protein
VDLLKSKELRQQRAKLVTEAQEILKKDKLTAEDRGKFDAMMTDADNLKADIDRYERVEAEARTGARPVKGDPDTPGDEKSEIEKRAKAYGDAFNVYLRRGLEGLTAEQRSVLDSGFVKAAPEGRAQTITTTGGGYLIPQGFQAELDRAMKAYGGVRSIARILPTSGGNPLPWPNVDDTGNTGEDKAINTAATGQDIVFGSTTLNAYKMDSGLVLVPNELFEDEGIDLNAELPSMLGERIGRRQNSKYTTGSGSSDFTGVTIAASLGGTFAGVAAITADELFDVFHSVDPAYRNSPKCAWEINDTTFKAIRKLKDSQNRYLFEASITVGAPDMLLGKPIVINQDMPAMTTGLRSVVFGDHSKFIIRDVRNIIVRRLNERYAEADQVGFIAWYRGDSKLVTASTKALVYWKQA